MRCCWWRLKSRYFLKIEMLLVHTVDFQIASEYMRVCTEKYFLMRICTGETKISRAESVRYKYKR
jgi:hypothetical protein